MATKKKSWSKEKITGFEKLSGNPERLQQVSVLLAPPKKKAACASILHHLFVWWKYREKCGHMSGEWIFKNHKTLARKCGLTERQSQDAVAALEDSGRIETGCRKIKKSRTLHLRPTSGTVKLLTYLSSRWLCGSTDFQQVWDEALDLDLFKSADPENITLHHIMATWDTDVNVISLQPEILKVFDAARKRLPTQTTHMSDLSDNQTTHMSDLQSTKPLKNGTSIKEKETKEIETEEIETPGNNLLELQEKKEEEIGYQKISYQKIYEEAHPELSTVKSQYLQFLKDHPDKTGWDFYDVPDANYNNSKNGPDNLKTI